MAALFWMTLARLADKALRVDLPVEMGMGLVVGLLLLIRVILVRGLLVQFY